MKWRFSVLVGLFVTLFAVPSQGSFQVSPGKGRTIDIKKEAKRNRFDYGQPNSGLFTPYETYWVGSWPEAVAIGDVNGDGRNDVVLTTSFYFDLENDYKAFVFLQNAAGELLPPERYDYGNGKSVDIADLNHDGRNDVVLSNSEGIGVLLQNAHGQLDPLRYYFLPFEIEKLRCGDFNADGLTDVVALPWDAGPVFVLHQNAGGFLNEPFVYCVDYHGSNDLEIGDINGDGLDDIVVLSGQGLSDFLGVLYQNPQGGFGAAVYYNGNDWPHGVAIGDLNGDSRNDVVVTNGGNWPSSYIAVFLQNAAGILNSVVAYDSYDIPEPAVIGDVSGDSKPDVIVAHGGWDALGVYVQDIAGTLLAEELYDLPYASHYNPHGLAVGDINSDGKNDVVIADYNNGLVKLYGTRGLNYTLSIDSSEGGTTDPSPGVYAFDPGTSVSIAAQPQNGHRFVGWSGDERGTANPLTIIMDSHKSIRANFAKQFALNLTTDIGGTTAPPPGIHSCDAGSKVVITAIPSPDFRFDRWSGSVATRDNPVTLTMNSDKVLTAHFIRKYRLALSSGGGGTTNPPPGFYTYDDGAAVRIAAVPDEHFQFSGWSGSISGSTNPVVVIMDSEKSIEARFQGTLYAPLNFRGVKTLNRSLSQAEYINVLDWQANPLNGDIEKYRVYLLDGGTRSLLAELSADTYQYSHRKVERTKLYVYWLVAVDQEYREGVPASATVR